MLASDDWQCDENDEKLKNNLVVIEVAIDFVSKNMPNGNSEMHPIISKRFSQCEVFLRKQDPAVVAECVDSKYRAETYRYLFGDCITMENIKNKYKRILFEEDLCI